MIDKTSLIGTIVLDGTMAYFHSVSHNVNVKGNIRNCLTGYVYNEKQYDYEFEEFHFGHWQLFALKDFPNKLCIHLQLIKSEWSIYVSELNH